MTRLFSNWTDQSIEQIIGNLLRFGVMLSAAVVLAGAGLYLRNYGHTLADYRIFRGEPNDLREVHGIIADALAGRGRGIIQFGLLLLIATPVARVAFSLFAFIMEKDWLYVGVTAVVLSLLLISLLGPL
ncbi:MAG TPA: DUF1634 domain-containing protein [Terriglobales bacterium]|nr:DUF1634 domain-containing protein [Terriglobales bacterium]